MSKPFSQPNLCPQRTTIIHLVGPPLTTWIYDAPRVATAGEVRLTDLEGRRAFQVHDAVTVSWLRGALADLDEVPPVIERGLARGDEPLMHALLSDEAPEVLRRAVRELQRHSSRQVTTTAAGQLRRSRHNPAGPEQPASRSRVLQARVAS